MLQTPFHAFYTAMKLNMLQDEDALLPVFAEGNIAVYPYQVAAARFAVRNPYQKGVILCDEAGMGKSYEAMLVISQSWYEGKNNILIAIPNPDLLVQWTEMIDEKYSIPYHIASEDDVFDYDGIILTTYDYLTQNIDNADTINWDIIVFEEANALSSVYQDENTFMGGIGSKQAKILKEFSKNTFKILLTGTPIEKNIMDLYGLIYFIDEELLPDPDTYMKRYLRKPENYPELAGKVSKYCFRTLRSQAKQYAKIPERLHITIEYEASEKEKELYNLLFAYIEKPDKIAFPQMEQYDLALMLLGLLSSSTAAIKASLKKVVKRLSNAEMIMQNAEIKLPCKIALYLIKIYAGGSEIKSIPVLVGVTDDNKILLHSECENILNSPVYSFEEQGDRKPYWLKSEKFDKMDGLVNLDEYVKKEEEKLTPMQHEEIDRMKLAAANKKNSLQHSLDGIELDMKQAEKEKESVRSDRLKLLMIERKISALKNELLKKKEGLFFDEMQIDVDLENKINEFLGREKITAKAARQFVVEVN